MNVVFIGASQFGLRCLQRLSQMTEVNVVGVVSAPELFSISYRPDGVKNVLHADFPDFCHSQQIPVALMEQKMDDPALIQRVKSWNPDLFLVVGWYHMITHIWRDIAPAYGLHASLLPDYSGGAPLVWAIINGEKKTGITMFQMDDGVDSGAIAGQLEEEIREDDTIATLYSRIEERGLELIEEVIPQLVDGSLALIEQDEALRHVVPQRGPEDGLIAWEQSAISINRFVRAQTCPYPGAFSLLRGERLIIWSGERVELERVGGGIGVVHAVNGECVVACGVGGYRLDDIEYQDRRYLRGNVLKLLEAGTQMASSG